MSKEVKGQKRLRSKEREEKRRTNYIAEKKGKRKKERESKGSKSKVEGEKLRETRMVEERKISLNEKEVKRKRLVSGIER